MNMHKGTYLCSFQFSSGADILYLLAFSHPSPKWPPIPSQLQYGDANLMHSGQIAKEPWSLFLAMLNCVKIETRGANPEEMVELHFE